ncbi:arylsulfatase [bacterium]|nr:arylsulfatase [bacterium]
MGASEAAALPNIVLILADDLGYGDVHCYNPERCKIPTPNIDRLAAEGMRFTDAHSSSAVCSPTRYSILTGRYHWRSRLQKGIVNVWEPPLIAADRLTIPALLKRRDYHTSCIGKWHLGWDWPFSEKEFKRLKEVASKIKADQIPTEADIKTWNKVFSETIRGGPTTRGFDTYFGTDIPNWPPFCFIENDRTLGVPSAYLPARLFRDNQASLQGPALQGWSLEKILPTLGDHACEYVAANLKRKEPFFLYLPLTSPHTPLAVNAEWKGKSHLNPYADFVMETDGLVGRILTAIESNGGADNTIVIFTSDNGCAPYIGAKFLETMGHFPSGPFRGYKADAFEGGHRIPFIIRWPGTVTAASVCSQTVCSVDLMATLAEIVGASIPTNAAEDSISIVPLLKGEGRPIRESLVHQSIDGVFAIRKGDWKLILGPGSGGWSEPRDHSPAANALPQKQLYNLRDDLAEKKNVIDVHANVAVEMGALLDKLIDDGRSTPGPRQKNDVTPVVEKN